jgi:hypothetical protein
MAGGSTDTFPVEGVGGVPATGVTDVYVVINVIGPSANGCIDDFSPDIGDPNICTTTFDAGNNVTDSDIVQVSSSGDISVSFNSYGVAATAGVVVTIMGYYQDQSGATAGDTYVGLPVVPLVDTRNGTGAPKAQIPAKGSLTVQIGGQGGVPSGVPGAAVYIGAANASAAGYVSAYPTGGTVSNLSLLSYVPGQVVRDLYFGALSSTGQLTLVNQGNAPVDLIVAVQGYLADPSATTAGSTYQDVSEVHIADTQNGLGGVGATPIPSNGSITFDVTGVDGVPANGVSAVAESVRGTDATATGFLSVYAAGSPDPSQPGVNFYTGANQGNGLTTALVSANVSTTGQQTITNHSSGTVDVIVTIRGYYASPTVPAAPEAVTTTVSGSTATVTWAAPNGDGGSPITGYVVSAPPDAATATVDGSTYQATLTGLASPSTDDYKVTAENAVGSSVSAEEISGNGTEVDSQQVEVSALPSTTGSGTLVDDSASRTMTAGGVTTTTAVTPDVSNLTDDAAVSGRSGAKCAPTQNNQAKQDGVPYYILSFNNFKQTSYYTISWLNHLFGVNNAYQVNGVEQWEVIGCTSGGAIDTAGPQSEAYLSENALTASSTSSQAIQNDAFGSKVTSSETITKSMGVQLGGSYSGASASLTASESVSFTLANAELAGSPGRDNQFGSLYRAPAKYDPARFNYRWYAVNDNGQSSDFVGNVGEVQWQFPMNGGTQYFYTNAVIGICNINDGVCGKHGN